MEKIVKFPSGAGDTISLLCDLYGSDKSTLSSGLKFSGGWDFHDYAPFYEMILSPLRFKIKSVLEVGLGTNNANLTSSMGVQGRPGASLRVWRDYFPVATIIGADIDKEILFQEDRIFTFYCDQTDPESISRFFTQCPIKRIELIIDDGLHTEEAAATFFENSYHKLIPGGRYFIEDAWWFDGEDIPFLKKRGVPYVVFGNSVHNRLIMVTK
jgi:hypothetical protein